jgi:hypothetical protein
MRPITRLPILLLGCILAGPAAAADTPPPPSVVQKLLDCRGIADATQRLACLDAGVSALAGAVESREVVVADKEQLQKARRGLFGITLPNLNLFGGKDGEGEENAPINEIEASIASARPGSGGYWRLVLDDGSVWVQTEARRIARDPRSGMKVRIRRAAAGTFFANIDGQTAVRVRRINE